MAQCSSAGHNADRTEGVASQLPQRLVIERLRDTETAYALHGKLLTAGHWTPLSTHPGDAIGCEAKGSTIHG